MIPSQHLTTINNTQQHTTTNTPTNAPMSQPSHNNHNDSFPWLSSAIDHEICQQIPKTTTIQQPTKSLHNGKQNLPGPSHPLDLQCLPTHSTGSGLPKQSHHWLIAYIAQITTVYQPATQANYPRSKTYHQNALLAIQPCHTPGKQFAVPPTHYPSLALQQTPSFLSSQFASSSITGTKPTISTPL